MLPHTQVNLSSTTLSDKYTLLYAHSHLLHAVIADCNSVPALVREGWMAKSV